MTDTGAEAGRWVTARVGTKGYRVEVEARTHRGFADEPLDAGGTDTGPTPYELLLTALGSCTAITLRMYADRKAWPLASATVHLRQARSHAPDCERCETEAVAIPRIERRIDLAGPLTDEQRRRILEIAARCPVGQTLAQGIRVDDVAS